METKVELLTYTPNPELVVAMAARTCYVNQDPNAIREKLTETEIDKIITTVLAKGHHSVLEHANFIFSISGVSRVLTHQLVRHRIASYSQLSQQRTDCSRLEYVVPPEIRCNDVLFQEYREIMVHCQELYGRMVKERIPGGSARYILPTAFTTRIIATLNARSLLNLLRQRECSTEEWEFREVAQLMHQELQKAAPRIFGNAGPPCEMDHICPEGEAGRNCNRRKQTGAMLANTNSAIKREVVVK